MVDSINMKKKKQQNLNKLVLKDYIEAVLNAKTVGRDEYDVKEKNAGSEDELQEDKD